MAFLRLFFVLFSVLVGCQSSTPWSEDSDDTSPTDTVTDPPDTDTGFVARTPRNLMLVTVDTMRYDLVMNYMPKLVARMADGTALDRQWGMGNWTRPTMPGIITGNTTVELGPELFVSQGQPRLPDSVTTLAEILSDDNGFASYLDNANDIWGGSVNGDQGYQSSVDNADHTVDFSSVNAQAGRVLTWLSETTAADRDDDDATLAPRWFAHVHTMDTHEPFYEKMLDESCEQEAKELDEGCRFPIIDGSIDMMSGQMAPSDEDYDDCMAAVAAAHQCVTVTFDENLDAFINRLYELGYMDDTMLVVTNDHGEGWGEHSFGHHRDLYAEVTRGFGFVLMPDAYGRAEGTVLDRSTGQNDFTPTVLAGLGIETDVPMDGYALDEIPSGRVVKQFDCNGEMRQYGAVSADGTRHLIVRLDNNGESRELYDPLGDPMEYVPLGEDPSPDLENAVLELQAATLDYCQ